MKSVVTIEGHKFSVKDYLLVGSDKAAKSVPASTPRAIPLLNITMMSDEKWHKRANAQKKTDLPAIAILFRL